MLTLIVAITTTLAVVGDPRRSGGQQKPAATEVGVTATEIHIAVMADVDNPLAPNIFVGTVTRSKASRSTSTRAVRPRTDAWQVASSWSTSTTRS